MTSRQRSSKKKESFCEVYDARCELHKTCSLPIVKAHLAENIIDLNAEKLSLADWEPFLESLPSGNNLKFIGIRSFNSSQNSYSKKLTSGKIVAPIKSPFIVKRLCEELEVVLHSSSRLACLELQNIQLTISDMVNLSKGIQNNNTIRHLSLEQCIMDDDSLRILADALNKKMNITSINLSQCDLKSKSVVILAQIIQNQSMLRHNQSWKDSLRYRNIDLDTAGGLRRLTLNRNSKLGNRGAEALACAIKDDVWLRALDLTACGISDSGATALLRALAENSVLQVLDVRLNPIMDKTILLRIMQQLNFNTQGHPSPLYKWLNLPAPSKSKAIRKISVLHRQRQTLKKATSCKPIKQHALPKLPKQRGIPWHVAARFGPNRGLSAPFVPGVASVFLQTATASSDSEPDDDHLTKNSPSKKQERIERQNRMKALAAIQEDLNTLRTCLNKEVEARREAERKVAELTKKNQELEERLSRTRRLSDDEETLVTIEETFTKFYNFLALLQKAGLGKLAVLSGFATNDTDQQGNYLPNLANGHGNTLHTSSTPQQMETGPSRSIERDVSGAGDMTSSKNSIKPQQDNAVINNGSNRTNMPPSSKTSNDTSKRTSTVSSSLSEQIETFTSEDEF